MATPLSSTYLNVSLSPTLSQQLQPTGNNGFVYMDALWFGQDGAAHWTSMVNQNKLVGATGGSWSIQLPQTTPNYGGKIYFLISSVANTQLTDPLPTLITKQADLTYVSTGANPDTSGVTNSYTFDSLEFALQNTPYDVANLTSVVGSGIPMGFATSATPTLKGAAGFQASDATIASNIKQTLSQGSNILGSFNAGPLAGQSNFIISPASNGQSQYKAADWKPYLDKLVTNSNNYTIDIARVAGVFNGASDGQAIYQNGAYYSYFVTAGTTNGVNYFLFTPSASSEVKQNILISEDQLAASIYSQQGQAYIFNPNWTLFTPHISPAMSHTGKSDASFPNDGFNASGGMNVGWNGVWGNIFTNFITSIDTGQLGVKGFSPNPNAAKINLSNSWNTSGAYAFGTGLTDTSALTTGPNALQPTNQYYDPYAKQFFLSTNSYGNAYTDNATKIFSVGGPDINITNGSTDLTSLYLTLYAFNETSVPTPATPQLQPTANDYVAPVLKTYIAPPNTSQGSANFYGYTPTKAPTTGNDYYPEYQGQLQINFNLPTANPGSPNVVTAPGTWAALSMMDPNTGKFIYTAIDPNSGYVQQLHYSNGAISVTSQMKNPIPKGEILLNGLPVSNGGTYWFQISVGDQNAAQNYNQKDFNLYLKTAPSGDLFDGAYSLSIDGGAKVDHAVGNGGYNGANVNLNIGSEIYVNGATMTVGSQSGGYTIAGTPTSPVAGLSYTADPFAMSTAYIYSNGTQGTQDTNTSVQITQAQLPYLVLGWTGMNDVNTGTPAKPSYYASSWISGYTNKAAGGDFVLATVTGSGVTYYIGGVAQADGQWALSQWYDSGFHALATAPTLPSGAYTITTQEYSPQSQPVAAASSALNLLLMG